MSGISLCRRTTSIMLAPGYHMTSMPMYASIVCSAAQSHPHYQELIVRCFSNMSKSSIVPLYGLQDQSTTVAVFFEIMTSKKQESAVDGAAGQTFYIQFITKYLNGQTGRTHCRVTTITRQCVPLHPALLCTSASRHAHVYVL